MAPLNGAAGKPAKTAARRTVSKPVVPVLPLNYPQRLPAAAKPAVSPSVTSPPTSAHPNGHTVQDKSSPRGAHQQDESFAELRLKGGRRSGQDNDYVMPSTAPPTMASSSAPGAATRASADNLEDTPTAASAVPNHTLALPTFSGPHADLHTSPHLHQVSDLSVANHPGPSFPPGMRNRPNFHHPHASNGSQVFGQPHDSNSSSPAPHPAASFPAPPPGIMPFLHTTQPVPALDGYGRPLVVSPSTNGYPPSTISHPGPPTPRSFHGSQSSPAEEAGFNPLHALNGYNGFPTDRTVHFPPGQVPAVEMPMNNGLHLTDHPAYHNLGAHDDLFDFLRHGAIGNDTFSDCLLEVHFRTLPQVFDHSEHPRLPHVFRAPSHRFILSRSPTLAREMSSLGIAAGGMLRFDIDDGYMRPDVFGHVFRSLYGWPLGDGGSPFPSDPPPRNIQEDMQTTLSYIATARYLRLGAAYSVSILRAARLLNWETIESLVAFVVPLAATDKGEPFRASELLEDITRFIINQFPQDFVLDVNANDSGFSRLPATEPARNPNRPPIAHGTPAGSHSRQSSNAQAQMAHPNRAPANPRISHIRFGDIGNLTIEDRNGDMTVHSRRLPTPNESILSQILLNLPFELLKRVLEHPLLTKRPVGDDNAMRHVLFSEIVAEREARRLRSLKPSTNAQLESFQRALENAARPLGVDRLGDYLVNNMGFKEEVLTGDGPYLGRTWTGGASGSSTSS